MANYTDNGIQFNNVKEYTTFVNGNVGVKGTQGVDPEWGGIINAIDIDWNGAQLKNGSTVKATLNTTGEMLSILQTV